MSLASDGKQEERGADHLLEFSNVKWGETLDSAQKDVDNVENPAVANELKKRLYISNISFTVHENLLSKFLSSKFGVRVAHCKIIRNAFNNESKVARRITNMFEWHLQHFFHYNSLMFAFVH